MIDALLIGGKGMIGAGLRTYLPKLDPEYRVTSADLPGADDRATNPDAHQHFVEFDASKDDAELRKALEGRDLVVYLARIDPLSEMNAMTDRVFKAIMDVCPNAVVIGSSSVHATGAAYYGYTREENSPIANRRFDERNDEFLEISISMLKIRSFLMPIVSLVGELCVVLVLFVGGHKVIEEGSSFTLGQLSAFIAYITILVNGLRSLGFLVGATQRGYLALGRIYEILDQPPGRTLDGEHPAFVDMETTFEIRDLSFTYPGAAEPTLRNISLTIEAGQTVGVFGYTGSGKTTLMSILARVYDPPVSTVFLIVPWLDCLQQQKDYKYGHF